MNKAGTLVTSFLARLDAHLARFRGQVGAYREYRRLIASAERQEGHYDG